MANELEIKATLDADGVSKGIDDVNNQLKSLETSAKKTGDAGAEGAAKWESALDSLKKGMPSASDAKGLDSVAESMTGAGSAAEAAQGAFAKLGQSLRGMGATVGTALRSAFSGLSSMLASLGRAAGTAFMLAFRVAMVAVPIAGAIAAALGYALYGAYQLADEAGKRWMKTFTDAFSAGMDPTQFNAVKAAFSAFTPDKADQAELTKSIGKMGETIREGGKDAEQLKTLLKAAGTSYEELAAGGVRTAQALRTAFETIDKLDPQQQARAWKMIFDGVPLDKIGEFIARMRQVGPVTEKMMNQINSSITQAAGEGQTDFGMMEAVDRVNAALSELKKAFDEVFGISDLMRSAMAQVPAALKIAEVALRSLAMVVRELPAAWAALKQSAAETVQAIKDTWSSMGAAIVQAIEGNRQAMVAAWQQTVDAIVAVWDTLVSKITGIFDSITNAAKSAADKVKSIWDSLPSFSFGGGKTTTGGGGGFRALPLQSPFDSNLFRAFSAAPTAQAFGMVGAPRAANDNAATVGGYTPAQWDKLLFNYKEFEKVKKSVVKTTQAETAANASLTSGLVAQNTQLGSMLSALGLTQAELREWVVNTALATEGADEWADAQARLKAALEAGMLTTEQYGAAFERLKAKMDTGPMQTAIRDLQQGMQSFADTAASSLADAIVNGEDLSQVFKNLAKQMASMLLQALVLKPLMNMLTGGIGGGGFMAIGPQAVAGSGVSALASPMLRGTSPTAGLSNFAGRGLSSDPQQQITNYNKTSISVDTGTGDTKVTTSQGVDFARKLDAAVQQILVKEQRPGGTLYRRQAAS